MMWIVTLLRTSRTAQRVVAVGLLIVAGLALYLWAGRQHQAVVRDATEAGRAQQQRDDLTETLNRTERANDADTAIRTNPDARRASCVRHSRTPENC